MMFLSSINQVREVEWGSTHLWDIRFEDAPHPFNQWFPAMSIDEGIATGVSESIPAFLNDFEIPIGSSSHKIELTVPDDAKGTLRRWYADWINQIYHKDKGVLTLRESVKRVDIIEYLNSTKTNKEQRTRLVFPVGSISFVGTSEAGLPTYRMSFAIAGE